MKRKRLRAADLGLSDLRLPRHLLQRLLAVQLAFRIDGLVQSPL